MTDTERERWRRLWGVEPGEPIPDGSRLTAHETVSWQAIAALRVLIDQWDYTRDELDRLVTFALER